MVRAFANKNKIKFDPIKFDGLSKVANYFRLK